ncbi:DUSAM domain-containing protein [Corallococcus coralloides]|uniref:DUSAM domain-containing protein n=1 Tax=Corallococcus coralloides TaxID=184914 RepID=UPI00384FB33A
MVEDLEGDWHQLRVLDTRAQTKGTLVLDDALRALLRRAGPSVAMTTAEVEAGLRTPEAALTLLHQMRQRVTEGSQRMGDAIHRMYRLRDQGDLDGARQQMRDLLAVEVVPYYRELAQGQLADLD